MAKDARGMKGHRPRNKNGKLRNTRDDKKVGSLEKQYGRNFGVRSDMLVGTLLERTGVSSVSRLIKNNLSSVKLSNIPVVPAIIKGVTQQMRNLTKWLPYGKSHH